MAGQVDSRLLITIAAMAVRYPVSIVAFGDSGPGVSAGLPFRSADLAQTDRAAAIGRAAYVLALTAFLRAQKPAGRASQIDVLRLPGGQFVLRVEFSAPSPLGLYASSAAGEAAAVSSLLASASSAVLPCKRQYLTP